MIYNFGSFSKQEETEKCNGYELKKDKKSSLFLKKTA